jgi:hypothetical protein
MRAKFKDCDWIKYRRQNWVRAQLLAALEGGNAATFKHHLREYLKIGSTARQAKILGIPERSLRRLSNEESDPKLSILVKIFLSFR